MLVLISKLVYPQQKIVENFFEDPISQYCMYKGNGGVNIIMYMLETVILGVDIQWKMVKHLNCITSAKREIKKE